VAWFEATSLGLGERLPPRKKRLIRPERIRGKVDESRFFLECIREHEEDRYKFGFFLSAFLCALKSVADLIPLVGADRNERKQLKKDVAQLRRANPALDYLLSVRDVEVHSEGAAIVMTMGSYLELRPRGVDFPRSRFSARFEGGFHPLYGSPLRSAGSSRSVPVYKHRWRFQDYPAPVIDVCRFCFNLLAVHVDQTLP